MIKNISAFFRLSHTFFMHHSFLYRYRIRLQYPNGGEANMTMIATVNPYNSTNNNNHFKITDVTDEVSAFYFTII